MQRRSCQDLFAAARRFSMRTTSAGSLAPEASSGRMQLGLDRVRRSRVSPQTRAEPDGADRSKACGSCRGRGREEHASTAPWKTTEQFSTAATGLSSRSFLKNASLTRGFARWTLISLQLGPDRVRRSRVSPQTRAGPDGVQRSKACGSCRSRGREEHAPTAPWKTTEQFSTAATGLSSRSFLKNASLTARRSPAGR